MLNIEFLDTLYRWKVEAEQELEILEEKRSELISNNGADHFIEMRELKIKHAEGLVNRYKNAIKSYIFHHNK